MTIENDTLSRVVAPKVEGRQEDALERALRPRALTEYVGQNKCRQYCGSLKTILKPQSASMFGNCPSTDLSSARRAVLIPFRHLRRFDSM